MLFPAIRCSGPQASASFTAKRAAGKDASVPGRRRHDQDRTFEKTTYNDLPYKFEAGTPNIADAIGLGVAIDYLNIIGLDKFAAYEHELLAYATEHLAASKACASSARRAKKLSVLSFTIDGIHPHDIGTILDQEGIAVRAGHHCAQPVMQRFGSGHGARSFAFYNTKEEIDMLARAIEKVIEVFG